MNRVGDNKTEAMKKLCLLIMITLPFAGNSQDDLTLLTNFTSSPDFAWFQANSSFAGNGQLNLARSYVDYQDYEGTQIPNLFLNFTEIQNGNEKIVGQIHAIKVRNDYNHLPKNARYLQLYRDLRAFDETTNSGQIKMYDLNYDEYLVADGMMADGEVTQLQDFRMPEEVAEKYNYYTQPTGELRPGPCETLQNSPNVSFGECMNCLFATCMEDLQCRLSCMLHHIRCNIIFNATCLIFSLIY